MVRQDSISHWFWFCLVCFFILFLSLAVATDDRKRKRVDCRRKAAATSKGRGGKRRVGHSLTGEYLAGSCAPLSAAHKGTAKAGDVTRQEGSATSKQVRQLHTAAI